MIDSPSFTPPAFSMQPAAGPDGPSVDRMLSCSCHRIVARSFETMTNLIDQTERVLGDARVLMDQAGAIDWEGEAAQAFRAGLVRASNMADGQLFSLVQARRLLEEETRA